MTTTTVNPIEKIFTQYEMLKEAEETLKAEIESVRSDIKDIVEEHGDGDRQRSVFEDGDCACELEWLGDVVRA